MRAMRILALLVIAAVPATSAGPARAQLGSATCDLCMRARPCSDDLQSCFLDCRARYPDPTAPDVTGLFETCNDECNRRFTTCTSLAQSECALARQCP